jgi:hypothetical protein
MSINQIGASYLMIGNVTNGYADNATYVVDAQPLGSVVLVKEDTKVTEEGALVAGTVYQLVNRLADGTIKRSPSFTSADIVSKEKQAYTLSTEQVSFFGKDASAVVGFGTPTTGATYNLNFWLNHTRNTLNNTPEIKTVHYIATSTSQATMAKGFQDAFLRTFSTLREPNKVILCDRVALTTSVAAGDTYTIAYLVNGSKTVTLYTKAVAADATLTASATTVAANTVINIPSYNGRTFTFTATAEDHVIYIGGTSYVVADAGDAAANSTDIAAAINAGTQARCTANGAGSTTITYREGQYFLPPMVLSDVDNAPATVAVTIATGDAVATKYKVATTATAAATFTLDNPYQGPTGYVYNGTTEATNIGEATLTSDTWGLKFTGVAQPFNKVTDRVDKVAFDVLSADFGSSVEYKAVLPTLGSGTYQQIAALEVFDQWSDRGVLVSAYPPTVYSAEATSGVGYDQITLILSKHPYTSVTTGISPENVFSIVIATKGTSAYDTISYDTLDTAFAV